MIVRKGNTPALTEKHHFYKRVRKIFRTKFLENMDCQDLDAKISISSA